MSLRVPTLHSQLSTNLTRPVSNTDIMPALTCRALDSFPSSAVTWASMSLRVSTFHYSLSTNRILPVSNMDIMPALTCRALDSFASSAEISTSMSLRISAMAVLSRRLRKALLGCVYLILLLLHIGFNKIV